jgi:hypothetical protein
VAVQVAQVDKTVFAAAAADVKTAIIPSPVVLTTWPFEAATAACKMLSWRSRAAFMA